MRASQADSALQHLPLDPADVKVQPQGRSVEQSWILDLYTLLHARDYTSFRILFPGNDDRQSTAHLLIPAGAGPHPVVVIFPILEGSHVVSEGLAKALVNRGYAAARMEREPLDLAEVSGAEAPARAMRNAILDARRLIDWLVTHPQLDAERIVVAGVSLGSVLALTLAEVDPRIQAGFFVMTGGGLADILYDSSEKPVRAFREQLRSRHGLETREDFLGYLEPYLREIDPLSYAGRLDAARILMISGRFDRVIRPKHTRRLWEALGRPRWIRMPAGHYQLAPFFWWCVGRGADHFDRVLGSPGTERTSQLEHRRPPARRSPLAGYSSRRSGPKEGS